MVGRFGSREICDVTFKALYENQRVGNKDFKAGQPVFVIDTATASSMEQATTTVYAQGGKGYNRLIAWEGEKTMTFNVTDALMSPMGLAILSGAGLVGESAVKHIHVTYDAVLKGETKTAEITLKELQDELGITSATIYVCKDTGVPVYGTKLDSNGAVMDWYDTVVVEGEATNGKVAVTSDAPLKLSITAGQAGDLVKFDFYIVMTTEATEIQIKPEDFGGFFYVEADTLYRNESGKDMAATLTFPKVKIQSGFTISMAPTGDPSTFDFVMDAFPAYTYFDQTKKVCCDITIVSGDTSADDGAKHSEEDHTP